MPPHTIIHLDNDAKNATADISNSSEVNSVRDSTSDVRVAVLHMGARAAATSEARETAGLVPAAALHPAGASAVSCGRRTLNAAALLLFLAAFLAVPASFCRGSATPIAVAKCSTLAW